MCATDVLGICTEDKESLCSDSESLVLELRDLTESYSTKCVDLENYESLYVHDHYCCYYSPTLFIRTPLGISRVLICKKFR